jgi:hypothetical protein
MDLPRFARHGDADTSTAPLFCGFLAQPRVHLDDLAVLVEPLDRRARLNLGEPPGLSDATRYLRALRGALRRCRR